MNIEDMHEGLKVRCVSAVLGDYIPAMTRLINQEVTVSHITNNNRVKLRESRGYIWSHEDFEPIIELVPVPDGALESILGL